MMVIIYNNNHLCRMINYCVMYRTQQNGEREGNREVGKRGRGEREGDEEGCRNEKK